MSGLRIEPLDARDDAAFDAYYDVYAGSLAPLGEIASPWMREEYREIVREEATRRWNGAFVGTVDGETVAAGFVWTPLLDNLDSAHVDVHVLPAHQRRGHGSAMLARLEQEAAARGRTLFDAEASWAYDVGADGHGAAGAAFLRARGYALGLSDVKRSLPMPVAGALLDELAAEAAPHHGAFELRSFVGRVPDELAQGWALLDASLVTEAPTGELDRDPAAPDVAAMRESEANSVLQGRTKFNTVALDAAGAVVAYTDIAVSTHDPGTAYQWGTLVQRDARGHRLGMAVKVANLKLLLAEGPGPDRVVTYNAEINSHMVGVNDRLGFVPVARLGEFQKRT
ncbi:GNAT family N-acetyltransferase [Nocardioides sp. CN2-186]|uniref:GNAT family N-acetyltransferase n=1 Tax=Nocardioides tweenelious TaxID=3156607 RepID=UPI0032B59A36